MENKPLVFISYSWEDEMHRQKVGFFVNYLKNKGINIIYDQDAPLGERVTDFMENNIEKSDFVLCLCTPIYKEKADRGIGGVKYEKNIITAELYEKGNEQKFIPILFYGSWEASLPIWAKGKLGIDYRTHSEEELKKLLNHLNSNIAKEDNYIFPFKWVHYKPKVNPLLKALIDKNFVKAEMLINNGSQLRDIDNTTFERCLYEFLNDYDTIKFLTQHKFNKFYFRFVQCLSAENYTWGIVARAYVLNRMDVIELLFASGFDLFDYGKYISNDKDYPLWKYCFMTRFDKELMNLLISYGYSKESILSYVSDPDFDDKRAANYILSNPKIELKGYSLGGFQKIKKPILPKIGIFTTKEQKKKIMEQYESDIESYNKEVEVQKKYVASITQEEWDLINESYRVNDLAMQALSDMAKNR